VLQPTSAVRQQVGVPGNLTISGQLACPSDGGKIIQSRAKVFINNNIVGFVDVF
jgi:hypothetical protein